ncbi:helicase-related protein [Helicobacter typhlonius]|uniref:helicase-related protein n=1 Tax=Helicobacter typhlonius TaxID=76936 RepID=UPI002FDFB445
MKEAKKILSYLKKCYPQEISVFEDMNARDRKGYAGYVLRKREDFISPMQWLERKYSVGMSFNQIAHKLGISHSEVIQAYESGMAKIKEILMNIDYVDFVKNKRQEHLEVGFEAKLEWLNPNLFEYQREIVKRACKKGRYALFMDTGLGKSITQINFAHCVHSYTNAPVLLLAPLAVVFQMLREAQRFGFALHKVENGVLKNGLNITNYEQLENMQGLETLAGIVLDESSILKSFTGSTKRALCEKFKNTPYKLACSATPSPNDYLELGNHSEFLGVMPSYEMIMRFFINDTMNAGGYRLKKHAESVFWEWVASWAECISSPADLGYDASAFILPPLREIIHRVRFDNVQYDAKDALFALPKSNATTLSKDKKSSLPFRIEKLKEILRQENSTPHLIWVDTNLEANELKKALLDEFSGIVEVRGNDSAEYKARNLIAFANGEIPILITKASIAGFGLNFQNASNMTFLGLNYSYESYYQAIRRMYRFGQKSEVIVNVILADSEVEILGILHKKKAQHDLMKQEMTKAICKSRSAKDLKDSWNTTLRIPSFLQSYSRS